MTTIITALFNDILQEACLIKSTNQTLEAPWQYPLTTKISSEYGKAAAQSLLELSHRVAVHNLQINEGNKDPIKLDPPNFDVVIPFDIKYMLQEVNILWFFYSTSMNIVALVFTSTYANILFLVDFSYSQVEPSSIENYGHGMKMHGGFWTHYLTIREKLLSTLNTYVNNETQILSTGISLGGALSTITTLDLYQRKLSEDVVIKDIVHYSFASPKVFNTIGAEHYNKFSLPSYRVHNGSDIITSTALPLMPISLRPLVTEDFMHVKNVSYFDRNLGSYYNNHVLAYLNEYDIQPLM